MAKRNNNKFKKRKFTEQQLRIIKNNYAKQKQHNITNIDSSKQIKNFELPLKNNDYCWNLYSVPNSILNGKQDNNIHTALVINELNDNVMLCQATHSEKKGKRNNIKIRNLVSSDLDINGNLQDSFLERRIIVSTNKNNKEKGINKSALLKKVNDLTFSEDEKKNILKELNHLSTAEERYNKFINLANKKNDT